MTTFMTSYDERHQVRCGLLAPARVGGASARVFLEPVSAVIAENAAKPVAGVMAVQLLRSDLVDVELAEVAPFDEALHRLGVIGEQVGRQSVLAVIGKVKRLFEVVERHDR